MGFDIRQLGATLYSFFGAWLDAEAERMRFAQRRSPLGGLAFVQALVFGFIENPRASLKDLSLVCLDVGIPISPQAIDQRITVSSVEFLKSVFRAAIERFKHRAALAVPLLQQFTAVNLVDSSLLPLPPNMAIEYAGCGRRGASAILKMQLVFDFLRGNLQQLTFASGCDPDQGYRGYLDTVQRDSLTLFDLGFFCLDAFKIIASDRQAYWLSRYLYPTAVLTLSGEPVELLSMLSATTDIVTDRPILLGARSAHRLPVRLVAVRAPQEVADRRRQHVKDKARKQGRTPNPTYLALLDWTIFVTNVPPDKLPVKHVLTLYRVRWQVELVFKLWKSYCGLGRIVNWRRERVLTELYAKMIGILLTHFLIAPLRLLDTTCPVLEVSPVRVRIILGRFARELNRSLASLEALTAALTGLLQQITLRGFKERRRKAPNVCHMLALVSATFDLPLDSEPPFDCALA